MDIAPDAMGRLLFVRMCLVGFNIYYIINDINHAGNQTKNKKTGEDSKEILFFKKMLREKQRNKNK
jgi:hypothetical protein